MSRSVPSVPASIAATLRPYTGVNSGSMTSLLPFDARHSSRWRPGLPDPQQHPCHNEIFASGSDGAGAALALALARDALVQTQVQMDDQRHVLWVQTRDAMKLCGRPYIHGVPPALRRRLIHVEAQDARDALFALEEGARRRDLTFVIGEVRGNPRELDFTASRRLTLTAQAHGSRLYLVRLDAKADLSSARMRWNARSAPSQRPQWNAHAPGNPAWKGELFRARAHPPGEWSLYEEAGKLTAAQSQKHLRRIPIPHAANASSETPNTGPNTHHKPAAHYGDMVRSTVGRSLAAL